MNDQKIKQAMADGHLVIGETIVVMVTDNRRTIFGKFEGFEKFGEDTLVKVGKYNSPIDDIDKLVVVAKSIEVI